jgi:hypothetical protein
MARSRGLGDVYKRQSLRNIIDLSMTHNPDRIFQALCRVVRRGLNGEKKTFIKVTTEGLAELTYLVMSFVVSLSLPEYYETFDGNWKDRKVRIKKTSGPGGKHTGKGRNKSPWEDLLPLPSLIDIKGMMSADSSLYAYTTFNETRQRLYGITAKGFWTRETCLAEARRHKTIQLFRKKAAGANAAATKYGWLESIKHELWPWVRKGSGFWSVKENCRVEALKYATRAEFRQKAKRCANSSVEHGWFDEVTAHMKRTKKAHGYWTVTTAMKKAKECQFRGEVPVAARRVLREAGLLQEACAHMPSRKPETAPRARKR